MSKEAAGADMSLLGTLCHRSGAQGPSMLLLLYLSLEVDVVRAWRVVVQNRNTKYLLQLGPAE